MIICCCCDNLTFNYKNKYQRRVAAETSKNQHGATNMISH